MAHYRDLRDPFRDARRKLWDSGAALRSLSRSNRIFHQFSIPASFHVIQQYFFLPLAINISRADFFAHIRAIPHSHILATKIPAAFSQGWIGQRCPHHGAPAAQEMTNKYFESLFKQAPCYSGYFGLRDSFRRLASCERQVYNLSKRSCGVFPSAPVDSSRCRAILLS